MEAIENENRAMPCGLALIFVGGGIGGMNPFVSSAVTKLWKPGGYWLGSGWRCSGCAHVVAEESGDCPFCKKSFVEPEYAAEE